MGRLISAAVLIAAAALSSPVHATTITYGLTNLGGNQFRYDYTVVNDGSITANLGLFDILFEPTLYDEASLLNVSDPSLALGWDQIFLSSGIAVPAAFDAYALDDGLGIGASVSFAVQFLWLGEGLPGAQPFEVYDPETFDLLGTGLSSFILPVSVSEPGTLGLLSLGLASFVALRRRNKRRGTESLWFH